MENGVLIALYAVVQMELLMIPMGISNVISASYPVTANCLINSCYVEMIGGGSVRKTVFWKFSKDFCMRMEILKLSTLLEIPAYAAGALVALLYGWGTGNADDNGSINDFTEKAIEDACMWDGKRGALVTALHAAGILSGDKENRADENPLCIESWNMVAEEILRSRCASRKRQQEYRERNKEYVGNALAEDRESPSNVTDNVTRDGMSYEADNVTRPKNKELRTKNIESRTSSAADSSTTRTRFSPPCIDEIDEYMRQRAKEKNMCINAHLEAERFADYYSANGWKVGKNPMKDWKAAVRNWLSRNSVRPANGQTTHLQQRTIADIDDLKTLYG